jgi:hypothetical protein
MLIDVDGFRAILILSLDRQEGHGRGRQSNSIFSWRSATQTLTG